MLHNISMVAMAPDGVLTPGAMASRINEALLKLVKMLIVMHRAKAEEGAQSKLGTLAAIEVPAKRGSPKLQSALGMQVRFQLASGLFLQTDRMTYHTVGTPTDISMTEKPGHAPRGCSSSRTSSTPGVRWV